VAGRQPHRASRRSAGRCPACGVPPLPPPCLHHTGFRSCPLVSPTRNGCAPSGGALPSAPNARQADPGATAWPSVRLALPAASQGLARGGSPESARAACNARTRGVWGAPEGHAGGATAARFSSHAWHVCLWWSLGPRLHLWPTAGGLGESLPVSHVVTNEAGAAAAGCGLLTLPVGRCALETSRLPHNVMHTPLPVCVPWPLPGLVRPWPRHKASHTPTGVQEAAQPA